MIRCQQLKWTGSAGWSMVSAAEGIAFRADLILVFGGCAALAAAEPILQLQDLYPGAILAGCSTAGEILGTEVSDEGLVATVLSFATTRVALACEGESRSFGSAEIGSRIAAQLQADDLIHVLVFADGIGVNGSELVRGLEAGLAAGVSITGGLAGDGARFRETVVRWESTLSRSGVVGIGFYGDRL